jgi:hypothetical protein
MHELGELCKGQKGKWERDLHRWVRKQSWALTLPEIYSFDLTLKMRTALVCTKRSTQ